MGATILKILLGLTLVLAVACGGAPAAPEPTFAPAAEPTATPIEGETSQPSPTPQVAASPAEGEVYPGKLTIMVGDLGSEQFDGTFLGGKPGAITMAGFCTGFSSLPMRTWSLSLV